eukprot:scaffold79375_cov75-Phaeocystis_antarctica.AAC.3
MPNDCGLRQGREPVYHVCRCAAHPLHAAEARGPVNKCRRAHSALEWCALAAAQPTVADDWHTGAAVVAHKRDQRVFEHTGLQQLDIDALDLARCRVSLGVRHGRQGVVA